MAYPFVESPHINRTEGRAIDLIVIHTMEMDEKGETAENCAQWFRNPGAEVSAHYCVDANSIVQCVRDQDVAWAAPGANRDGLQIEHAGRAKQTGRDWSDAYSTAMLERSATLVAGILYFLHSSAASAAERSSIAVEYASLQSRPVCFARPACSIWSPSLFAPGAAQATSWSRTHWTIELLSMQ